MKNNTVLKISIFLFFLNLIVYLVFRSFVGVALTGGDTVNLAKDTSYRLTLDQIKYPKAFLIELMAGNDLLADKTPGHFLLSLFSDEGRKSIARLATGSGDARDQEVFNFEMNSRVLDKEPVVLQVYEAFKNSSSMSFQEFASIIHGRIIQKEPPSIGYWLKSVFDTTPLLPGEGARFLVVAHIYITVAQNYLTTYPDNVFPVIAFMAFVYATLMTFLFLLAYELTKSVFWSILAVLVYQGSPATVKASFNLYCMPYLFVPLVMVITLYAYIRYKANGERIWLGVCVLFAFLSPWVREFGGAAPYIIFATEIVCFKGRRSALLMWLSVPLMIHSLYPSLLLSLLGIYKGHVYTHFTSVHAKTFVNQTEWPLWHMFAMLFSQIAPMLWLILVTSIIVWLIRFWTSSAEQGLEIPILNWRIPCPFLSLPKIRLALAIFLPLLEGGVAIAFCNSYFVLNQEVQDTHVIWGVALFLLIPLVVLPSFRFNAVLPVYLLAMSIPFIRIVLGDIHFSFTLPPLAILAALWTRDLWESISALPSQNRRAFALVTFMCLLGIGVTDQLMNIPASALTQRELVKGDMEIAEWIKTNLPKHSIMIGNSYNFTDISYYSKYHLTSYVSNSDGYGLRVIPSKPELMNLLKNNQGVRDVYFLASDHPYYNYQINFHSHQFVKSPPGKIIKLAEFNMSNIYSYVDPIKYFVPRFFIPQAGYQDWETDFYFNNLDIPFRRIYNADFAIFKLA